MYVSSVILGNGLDKDGWYNAERSKFAMHAIIYSIMQFSLFVLVITDALDIHLAVKPKRARSTRSNSRTRGDKSKDDTTEW